MGLVSKIHTFDISFICLAWGPRILRTVTRSEPLRTNERAIISILLGTPQPRISSLSFSVRVGRSTTTPGRFTFFLSPNIAVFSQRHTTLPASGSQDKTVRVIVPSEHNILFPGFKSTASF